jgi:hypothetical protein
MAHPIKPTAENCSLAELETAVKAVPFEESTHKSGYLYLDINYSG